MNQADIWKLIKDIEKGERWLTKHLEPALPCADYYCMHMGDVKFTSNDGWTVIVFFDCGEWDYFDSFTDPEGQALEFSDFSVELQNYRPSKHIAMVMYGEPGYLGCWLKEE